MTVQRAPSISRTIFRAYDIRGIVGKDLTGEGCYWIGRALGTMMQQRGLDSICVAWDGRLSSPMLAQHLMQGLQESGRHVIELGAEPTGLLYFATHESPSCSGVMITGSHNPIEYNGLKIVLNRLPLSEDELLDLHARIERQDVISATGSHETLSLHDQYVTRLCQDINLQRPLRIAVDAGNGIAGPAALHALTRLGIEHVPLYCEVDGQFPNHHPDPGVPENVLALQHTVITQQLDVGLAYDGDGDRIALIDNEGTIIWPDRLLMLLLQDIVPRYPGAPILYDVKTSGQVTQLIKQLGGTPMMWRTGHSLMKQKLAEVGSPIGGEFSGHLYIQDRWYGVDDGIYSGLRLLELLSRQPLSSAELFRSLPDELSTPEITFTTQEDRKFDILKALASDDELLQGATLCDIDGLRLEFDEGWALIRASNTTPKLTLRFAGQSQAVIEALKLRMLHALKRHAPELSVTL